MSWEKKNPRHRVDDAGCLIDSVSRRFAALSFGLEAGLITSAAVGAAIAAAAASAATATAVAAAAAGTPLFAFLGDVDGELAALVRRAVERFDGRLGLFF